MPRALRAIPSSRRAPSAREIRERARRRPPRHSSSHGPGGREQRVPGVHPGGQPALVAVGQQVHGAAERRPRRPSASPATNCTEPSRSSRPARTAARRSCGQRGLEQPHRRGAVAGHAARGRGRGRPGRPGRRRPAPGRAARGPGRSWRRRRRTRTSARRPGPRLDRSRQRALEVAGQVPVPGQLAGHLGRRVRLAASSASAAARCSRARSPGSSSAYTTSRKAGWWKPTLSSSAHLGHVGVDGHAEQVLDVLLGGVDGARRAAGPTRPGRSPPPPAAAARVSRGRCSTRARSSSCSVAGSGPGPSPGEDELLDEERVAGRARPASPRAAPGGSGWPASSVDQACGVGAVQAAAPGSADAVSRPSSASHGPSVRDSSRRVLAVGQQHQHPLVGEVGGQEAPAGRGSTGPPSARPRRRAAPAAGRSSGRAGRARPGTAAAGRTPRSPDSGSGAGWSAPRPEAAAARAPATGASPGGPPRSRWCGAAPG